MRPSRSPFRIAMIPTANGGVNYYRMATWAFQMRKYRGIEVALFAFRYDMNEVHPWQKDLIANRAVREGIESLCKVADAVIWQPVHYAHSFEFFNEMRQKYGKLTIVETDDNFVDVPPWNEAFRSFSPNSYHRRIAIECMRMADGMVVTTPHLKELYSQFNENVHVMENSLDFKGDSKFMGWDRVSVRRHKGIRLGWIGGRSHFNDLMMVAPALRAVLERHPEVTICFVNSALKASCKALGRPFPFEGLSNVHYVDRSVPIHRYAKFAAHFGFDIGIAPLVDCNFNRSKSNLRWLEYSALGIPCVATDISHFSQSIRPNEDGILIKGNDLQAWENALEKLIEDTVLRQTMGRIASKRVRNDFNVKKNAPDYIRLIKRLANTAVMGDSQEEAWISERSKPSLAI